MRFTVEIDGVKMDCRVFERTGGYRGGRVCLSGYVQGEQRMECDVTTTARACKTPKRFRDEMVKSAMSRLRRIAHE